MIDFNLVKRYDNNISYDCPIMIESEEGDYVSFDDYQALLDAYKEIKLAYEGCAND